MHDLLDIEYYYNQANLKLKENDKESAINLYYMSWQKYNESDSPRIPKKFEEIATAVLKGNGICGLIQGLLGGALFSIMGISSPILWGCIMAVLAFLPIFGIGLVMVPAAFLLVVNERMAAGIFLLCFYLVLSFSVEYLVKPKLVGNQVQMHTLLVFLSIIGGLSVYGILGIIYGPLIVTGFLTLSDIYLKKYDYYVKRL